MATTQQEDFTSGILPNMQVVTGGQCHLQRSRTLSAGWTIDSKATWPSHTGPPTSLEKTGIRPISRQDIVIAVMGPTGTGKSSFINTATNQTHTNVGNDLESCTQEVRAVSCPHRDGSGRQVVLVDTPGFDDTSLSDSDILECIAQWLTATYKEHVLLTGLLFFHRISDNRLSGTPLRNLSMFEKLCGPGALQNVILATTMWDEVDEGTGLMREEQLRTVYWKPMITFGSRVARFRNTYHSAWDIIDKFVNVTQRPVLLQREMVDQGKDLAHTSAGSVLYQFWEKVISNFREILRKLEMRLRAASKGNNPEAAAAVEKDKMDLCKQLEQAQKQKRKVMVRRSSLLSQKSRSRPVSPSPLKPYHPKNEPGDNKNGIETRGRTLAGIICVLEHVESVGRIAPVPFLSGPAGLVLAIARSVQAAKITENSLLTLTHDAGRLIISIAEQAQSGDVPDGMMKDVNNLLGELKNVQMLVDKISSRGLMSRYIFQAADEQVVSACHNSIKLACECFELRTSISTHQTLARIEAHLLAMSTPKLTSSRPCSPSFNSIKPE